MNKNEIFKLLNENPVFYLATVENNKPHVRGMLLFRADEDGIIFHTSELKDLYKQISANNNVELCFNCKGTQIRISGTLENVTKNENLKEEIYSHPSREFLRKWAEEGYNTGLVIYKLKDGEAITWTMADNFNFEKSPIKL